MIYANEATNTPLFCNHHRFKRISWTAIFIGALVGVGLSFLLSLFGISIGISAFSLSDDGTVGLAIGGLIGIIIGVIAAMMSAGYAAGYLGRFHCPERNLGIVYGFTTWSSALLLNALLGAQVSAYVAFYANTISHAFFVTVADKTASATTLAEATPSANSLAWSAFYVFVIFFIGALASCAGACWGMSCKRDD